MASPAHQFIADLLARKMSLDGFDVVGFEGVSSTQAVKLKIPPKISRHRPDLIGIKHNGLAVGEAKTASDVGLRTRDQIQDFTSCADLITVPVYKVYFGIPQSARCAFDSLLKELAINRDVLEIIWVPDRLLP